MTQLAPLRLKRIFALAVPVSLQAVLTSSLSFVDIYMVSSLGAASVAAVGLISKVYFVAILMIIGLSSGVSLLVAQHWGARQREAVMGFLWAGLAWVVLLTLPLSLLAFLGSGTVAAWMTPDILVKTNTANYWYWTSPFAVLSGISFILATVQRATDDAFGPLVAAGLAMVINTGLNYLVLFGPIEAFNLGLYGVAIATNISRVLEVLLLVWLLKRHLRPGWRWSVSRFWEVWRYGRVLVLNETLWSAGLFAFFLVYSYMGAAPLAVMSLLSPIESILIDVFVGFGIAASILIGQHLGRREYDVAWQLSRFFLFWFPLAAAVLGLVLALAVQWVLAAFSSVEPEVLELMGPVWLVFCLALPVRTHNMIAVIGVLRAGGDNRFVLLTEVVSLWLLAVSLSAIFGLLLQMPLWWVVALACSEEIGKVALFQWRIRRRIWLRNLTGEATATA